MSMTPGPKIPGYQQFSTQSPQQEQLFNQLLSGFGGGNSFLQNLLGNSPESLETFSKPHLRQFQQQIVPQIAEGFSGAGAGKSSAFQQTLASAGTDLSERLASMRGNQQMQLLPILQSLLGQSTQGLIPESKPWWQEALTGLAGGAGSALGQGAVQGLPAILSLLSKLFSGNSQQFSGFGG